MAVEKVFYVEVILYHMRQWDKDNCKIQGKKWKDWSWIGIFTAGCVRFYFNRDIPTQYACKISSIILCI